jgi:hypothetical protein
MNSPTVHTTAAPQRTHHFYATASWMSLTATAVVVGVHHVYREGWQVLIPFAILALLPYPLVRWFRTTGAWPSLWAYGLLSTLTIAGFGVVDGFLDHVTNAFVGLYSALSGQDADRVERAFRVLPPTPLVGDSFYEVTGVLEFVGATVAAYYAYRFLRAAVGQRAHVAARARASAVVAQAGH